MITESKNFGTDSNFRDGLPLSLTYVVAHADWKSP